MSSRRRISLADLPAAPPTSQPEASAAGESVPVPPTAATPGVFGTTDLASPAPALASVPEQGVEQDLASATLEQVTDQGTAVAQPKAPQKTPSGRSARSSTVRAAPLTEQQPEGGAEGPRYLRFEPKTVRLTADQVDTLQQIEGRLRRAARGKRGRGDELPSWNMIARAGVDLVLREAAAGRLAGVTEDEIRASLGLDPLGF